MSPKTAEPVVSPADGLREAVKSIPSDGNVIEDLFNRAYALSEAKTVVLEMRVAVRESLRNLNIAGVLNEAQEQELISLFPPRERKAGEDEEEDSGEGNGATE
jgi:hypothetical protein